MEDNQCVDGINALNATVESKQATVSNDSNIAMLAGSPVYAEGHCSNSACECVSHAQRAAICVDSTDLLSDATLDQSYRLMPSVGDNGLVKGRLVLLRHGQTAWSKSGQHTGHTNIPLTATGRQQALAAGVRLRKALPAGFAQDCRFASPLLRAQQTAQLAGFDHCQSVPEIMEWDYGAAEGRTRGDVVRLRGADWDVWRDGPQCLPEHLVTDDSEVLSDGTVVTIQRTHGESLDEVSARTQKVIDLVLPKLDAGQDVLVVAHAHVLRILTARWLGMSPLAALSLRLDTAHFSVLGMYKSDRVIISWNC